MSTFHDYKDAAGNWMRVELDRNGTLVRAWSDVSDNNRAQWHLLSSAGALDLVAKDLREGAALVPA